MLARHAALLVAMGALALVGAGCYGDTDEASNVGGHAATLNFHGKANSGPAYTYFEYWKTAEPNNKLKTPTRNWPAGAEGSFWERPQHLSEQTGYAYRLCGNDQGKWPPACASTKQFTTGRAVSSAAVDGNNVMQFQDDPGVNSNLTEDVNIFTGDVWWTERFCADMTCGSHISAGAGCSAGSDSTSSSVSCSGSRYNIRLGDLDDTAGVSFAATVDGGPGDDFLFNNAPFAWPVTLIGGSGRDDLRGGPGDDMINARSASYLNPDTDKSISCGAGEDTVIADRSDPISAGQNGCEHVFKP